ncbi:MAG: hypothetical protein ABEK04_03635 [Candidatus Nanohalobium sp.]
MSQVILASAFIAWIFFYVAKETEIEGETGFNGLEAVVLFANQFLGYSTVLATLYLAVTELNYTKLPSGILGSLAQIYVLLIILIFVFKFWSLLTKMKQDNIETEGGEP